MALNLQRHALAIVGIVALAGCNQKAKDAADRYVALANSGATKAQLCRAAQEAEVEWRLLKDASQTSLWQARRLGDCIEASM